MTERIERVVVTEQSAVLAPAIISHFENLLELGAETARERACIDCAHLALCGIAINTLLEKKPAPGIESSDKIDIGGVNIDQSAGLICPGELVTEALRRNQINDFWLLDADELNGATLEVRTAQTVQLAAKHIRHIVSNKIIV